LLHLDAGAMLMDFPQPFFFRLLDKHEMFKNYRTCACTHVHINYISIMPFILWTRPFV